MDIDHRRALKRSRRLIEQTREELAQHYREMETARATVNRSIEILSRARPSPSAARRRIDRG
jgi:hypothetical protein